ncbi:MAG TPA: hypothetical protein VHD32_04050 [Candidatus Didemnitutus sp.]|nr:hypothetical protein [Candidatus Didemnitutus sp.]
MDDSLIELEQELARLRPVKPSLALQARIEADLARGDSRAEIPLTEKPLSGARRNLRMAWSLCAAAAAVIVATTWRGVGTEPVGMDRRNESGTDAVVSNATPPSADVATVLYGASPESGVYLHDQTPVQQVRYRYLDTYTWRNPATHASMQWTVPRDEIRVVAASLH